MATKAQKREYAKAKIAELQEQLAEQVEELASTEGWKRYLASAARFHKYSLNNILLIAAQDPNATQVAGYGDWQKLGRQVRKGETGIKVLAPLTGPCRDCGGDGCLKCGGSGRYLWFKAVTVFDVAQTDGDPLPENPAVPELLRGEDEEGWFDRVAELLPEGWTLEVGDTESPANGWTQHGEKHVRISDTLEPAARLKTLVHELAHVELHNPKTTNYRANRGRCECEAESVAYVVLGALGIDSVSYSLGYVAEWTEGNAEVVRVAGAAVTQTAKTILDRLFTDEDVVTAEPAATAAA